MDKHTAELRVGILIILALIIFGYGIIWIKGYKFRAEHYTLEVLFPRVGNLGIGDPVSVLGVDKGEVKEIRLKGGDVLVTLSMASDVTLKEDATFTVKNIGLMGERFIDVESGHSDTLLNRSFPAKGYYDTGIPEVMGLTGRAVEEIRELVKILRGSVINEGTALQVNDIITKLQKITTETYELLGGNKEKIGSAVEDLSQTSKDLRTLVQANKGKLETTVDNFEKSSRGLAEAASSLEELSANLKSITAKLESEEGTFGMLLKDRSLYDDLKKTTADLDSLVIDIKKNPKKYIHLEIF
jgi:phospholipid/cholesterol/gamma-HCH transport system substrate-binding protein